MSRYPSITLSQSNIEKRCQIVWNFFVTNNVKGEVDGIGVLHKQEVLKE
jgi:hypothetical protein